MTGSYIFTATDFVNKCLALAKEYKTVYALGMWGWKLTREAINAKARQLPDFYTEAEKRKLYALADEGGCWGFDCVCMIKALLWGWDGSDLPRGGAKYASNGVPDFGADAIGKYCDGYSTDFSKIEPGEVLHMPGHVGVYVGDGLAVECTRAWEAKVIVTAVGNIGKKAGYHTRTWTHHGKLKWIDYTEEDQPMTPAEKKEFDELKAEVGSLAETVTSLGDMVADLKSEIDSTNESVDALAELVADMYPKLKVYETWDDVQKGIPWAYAPLRAMQAAGFFAGSSPDRPNVNRTKAECLCCEAAALKAQGVIDY